MKDICKNCGAWHGLHKWDNDQCPRNGIEANYPKKQEYQNTFYQEEDNFTDELATLRAQNAELREALEAITERAEAVSEGIVVEKRNPGVSQATHVSHMASHLAQHTKKARAILAKYGDDNEI